MSGNPAADTSVTASSAPLGITGANCAPLKIHDKIATNSIIRIRIL